MGPSGTRSEDVGGKSYALLSQHCCRVSGGSCGEAVPDGGMVVIKGGSHNEGMVLTKRMQVNSWSGSTVIGTALP